ncbi:MAG: hypothetical protein ABEI32_02315 [Halothece sp.]
MTSSLERQIIDPDRDGRSMADNPQQFPWMVLIKENLQEVQEANQRAEQESQRAERLTAQLRALGVDPKA